MSYFKPPLAYTGIGSRKTPAGVIQLMQGTAGWLAARGFVLRSGGADGADMAFEIGAGDGPKEIYLPWRGFNGNRSPLFNLTNGAAAAEIAATIHPAWPRLKPSVQGLHTRNVYQVLGQDLADPAQFVVCWTPDGAQTEQERSADTGGTGTVIALAIRRGVPVINLARVGAMDRLTALVIGAGPL